MINSEIITCRPNQIQKQVTVFKKKQKSIIYLQAGIMVAILGYLASIAPSIAGTLVIWHSLAILNTFAIGLNAPTSTRNTVREQERRIRIT